MRAFDHDYVNELITRLGRIDPESTPRRGTMSRDKMIAHLCATVRFAKGKGPPLPYVGNWFSCRVLGPLVLNGILKLPTNVGIPQPAGEPAAAPHGDIEALHAELEDYLNLVQAGALSPPPHPLFGDIGIDGWARLHVLHFEHHLRQFGA